jgi:hypothetical protein
MTIFCQVGGVPTEIRTVYLLNAETSSNETTQTGSLTCTRIKHNVVWWRNRRLGRPLSSGDKNGGSTFIQDVCTYQITTLSIKFRDCL